MIETILNAASEVATLGKEVIESIFDFKLPELFGNKEPEAVPDAVLQTRIEAAAHSATTFFNLPDIPIREGDSVGVYTNLEGTFLDDVLEYNVDQFKEMDCTSFEDMTKVWAHECGHRLLQNIFPSSWADELGADFFAGVRSEMLGLPRSNFEDTLAATGPSESHPGGDLRMQAMDYGRFAVQQMREMGVEPTWQNCIATFQVSPFASMSFEGYLLGMNGMGVSDLAGVPAAADVPGMAADVSGQTGNADMAAAPATGGVPEYNVASSPQYGYNELGQAVVTDIFGGQHTFSSMDMAMDLTDVFSGLPANEHSWDASIAMNQAKLDRGNELESARDAAVSQYKDAKSRGDYAEAAKWEGVANSYQGQLETHWGVGYSLTPKAPGIS